MNTRRCNILALWAILALCCVTVTEQHSVVVVGAGASGLGAATRLLANGLNDVTVLEAEARIGGRVNSVPFGDAIVELGAEWCHGQEGNAVYDLVKDLDLLEQMEPGMDIVFSNGKSLGAKHSEELLGKFMRITHAPDEVFDANKTRGEQFQSAFISAVEEMYHDDPDTLSYSKKTMPLMERFMMALDSSFSWHNAAAVANYKECPGIQSLIWKGKGYNQIFDVMAKKIPKSDEAPLPLEGKIHFNKVVSKINYSGAKPVVTCADGSDYTADFVLFTPSLGVLKHDHKSLFEPALPAEKVEAIEDLGIDAVMKIILHFPDVWWPRDLGFGYYFVFTEEDEKEIASLFPNCPMKDGKSWLTSLMAMMPAEHNPHVTYNWFTGPLLPEIEKMPEEHIINGLSYVFNKIFSKANTTRADKMIRYPWYTNPHFRGSYSYETLKSKRQGECAHMILARPLKNTDGKEVLFFAGEATHMTHYSTVHGAVQSGYREADRILKKHQNHE